jgi:mono/diheme cytochrome c family protein
MRFLERNARLVCAILATVTVGIGTHPMFAAPSAPSEPPVSFKQQVLPIFQEHCNMCHTPGGVGYISVSLDLRSYSGLKSGSAAGVTIIPFHADHSPLMRVLVDAWHSPDQNALRMPPLGPQLSTDDLDVIGRWIDQGAKNN